MNNQNKKTLQLHIWSDESCVLYLLNTYTTSTEGYVILLKNSLKTTIKFADQAQARLELAVTGVIEMGEELLPNTIYTIEGYESTQICGQGCGNCRPIECTSKLATLKRIEPVVEQQDLTMNKIIAAVNEIGPIPSIGHSLGGFNITVMEDLTMTAKPGKPIILLHPLDYKAYKESLPSNPPKHNG